MKWVASKRLVLVLAVALALRMAAGLWWHSRLEGRFGFADSQSFWALGQAIARGQPYQFGSEEARIFRTPGYTLLLAPIFLPAGPQPSVMSARALSAVLGTLAVAGVWWLGREVFDARTGLLAATVAAFYPGAVALVVTHKSCLVLAN
jgi:4-amino-4-deoxy-L-arabinose transferase-like glycosyltransferase